MSDAGPSTARRRPGRPSLPPAAQRERLIEAAARLMGRSDIVSASVKDIVAEAGMSSRSFYEHFGSKDEVLIELVDRASQSFLLRLAQVVAETRGVPADWVDTVLGVYFDTLAPVVAFDRKRLGDETRERVEVYRSEGISRLLDLLMPRVEALHAQGGIERCPSRGAVELVLLGIEAMTVRYGRAGRLEALAELRAAVRELAAGLLGEIRDPTAESSSE